MKRTALALLFILSLLISALAATVFVRSVKANPLIGSYIYSGEVSPEAAGAEPPIITILSPQENNTYSYPDVLLSFNFTVGETSANTHQGIDRVYYRGDWEESRHLVGYHTSYTATFDIPEFSINLTVPEGKHEITIWAEGDGSYWVDDAAYESYSGFRGRIYGFDINGTESVVFTVDTTSPTVSVLSVKNETYRTSEIPLNFTVNELVSQINYCLDGQENVAVLGNTTLTGLSNGEHSLTVYATDEAGNAGASKTITFSVDVPFPTTLAAASVSGVSVIIFCLLVYFKKRKR
jgi:hypothetical protein